MRIIARMNIGGPAVQIANLMRGLNSLEFEQRLVIGSCEYWEEDYLKLVANDIEATRIKGFGRRVNLVSDLKALVTLVREIRRFKPDIIHTHTTKAGFLGRLASIISLHHSVRVHTYHGHLLYGYFGKLKTWVIVLVERTLARVTHKLLTVGSKTRDELLRAKIGEFDKFQLMPPGLQINELPTKIESQTSLGLNTGHLQCGYIGRVTKIKRPDRFLDVVDEIKRRGFDLQFFIAGDGDLLEQCKERILNDALPVQVLGWQSDIEKVLSAADVVVLTSDNEGTPLSLIQAGMASLPVVSTNVGSVSEVVLDQVTGVLTSLEVNEIADSLVRLSRDKDLRDTFGKAAQQYTSFHFGAVKFIQEHEELYKCIVTCLAKF